MTNTNLFIKKFPQLIQEIEQNENKEELLSIINAQILDDTHIIDSSRR